MKLPEISIIGTGYVGLITGILFSKNGYNTICLDIDSDKVEKIKSGKPHFYEPDLERELVYQIGSGRLKASTKLIENIKNSNICFICVGTPSNIDGSTNLDNINAASRDIGGAVKQSKKNHLIVVKSTVPPGTTEKIVRKTIENYSGKKAGKDFSLCINPEFFREGSALHDGLNPDRIIIGEFDERSGERLQALYSDLNCPIIRTPIMTAELIKYSANSLLATKISFANEISRLCTKLGSDVYKVMEGVGLDHRISNSFLRSGLGFGGSCFPKDLASLIHLAGELNVEIPLLEAVYNSNKVQPEFLVSIIEKNIPINNTVVAVLGLAYKPGTDDVRETRALPLIKALHNRGAIIKVYDPVASDNFRGIIDIPITYCESIEDTLHGSDFAVIQTEWEEFKSFPIERYKKLLKMPLIFDGRRIFEPEIMKQQGIRYIGIGFDNKQNVS